MNKIQIAETTMNEFRKQILGDEAMLKFAADHLDLPGETRVQIIINDPLVTFAIIDEGRNDG